MNGLEAILSRILREAEAQATEILRGAEASAAAIAAEATAESRRILEASQNTVSIETGAIQRRTESTLNLDARRIRLAAKQHLVSDLLDEAIQRLSTLPDPDRAALYVSFLEEAGNGGEEVSFPEADHGSGFARSVLDTANRQLSDKKSGFVPLRLSAQPHGAKGGIILSKDDIENNLTFDLIARQHREDLEAFAASLLFD